MKVIVALVALVVLCSTPRAFAEGGAGPDWPAIAEMSTVVVVTLDEDGAERVTTVWVLVHEGRGYVRTGNSRWGENIVRNAELTLRVGEAEFPMAVTFEEDDVRRGLIKQGFRDKYGWFDGMISWVRGDRPKHMQMELKQ